MAARIDSLQALQLVARGKPSLEIILDLLNVDSYVAFVNCIHRALDLVLRRMAENPELRNAKKEDELTIEVVSLLRMMDIDAGHDTKVGGHVDIVVRGPNDFAWLAEAKKNTGGNGWLFQGFQQLNTRYSTGLPGQDSGGLLIYSDRARIDLTMQGWRDYLATQINGITFLQCDLNALAFLSSHVHDKTGRPYSVRHVPLSLYFEPKDKKK
jgi:hypothetical protein